MKNRFSSDTAQVHWICLDLMDGLHTILGAADAYLRRTELLARDAIACGLVHEDRLHRFFLDGELVETQRELRRNRAIESHSGRQIEIAAADVVGALAGLGVGKIE